MYRKLGPLAALAMAVLIGAGCSNAPDENGGAGDANADFKNAVKFSECMRDNGVAEFPDPDASGELTVDGVLNGSSLDPDTPAWRDATAACKDLEPPGYTGDDEVTPEEQEGRLAFAQCMRDNGVEDFPDPVEGEPLVDTTKIPSAASAAGHSAVRAAMEACRDRAAAAGVTGP